MTLPDKLVEEAVLASRDLDNWDNLLSAEQEALSDEIERLLKSSALDRKVKADLREKFHATLKRSYLSPIQPDETPADYLKRSASEFAQREQAIRLARSQHPRNRTEEGDRW